MPTYEYRCRKCGHRFELFHGIRDETPKRCPRCRSRALRVPAGGGGLIFRGTGFHVTDYRSRSYREKAKQEKPAGSGGEGGGKSGGEGGGKSGGEGGGEGGGGGGGSGGGGPSGSPG